VSYGFIAALMAAGVGILVGASMYRPYYHYEVHGAGYGFGAGFVMFGGLLLLLVILRRVAAWIAARRHGRPLAAPAPFRAFLLIALLLAAGIGILVGTSWYQPYYYDRVGSVGAAAYAFGTGILIFAGQLLLFMLIRGMSEWTRSRNDPRNPSAAETPNGPGATQAGRPVEQTGAWQPRSPVA